MTHAFRFPSLSGALSAAAVCAALTFSAAAQPAHAGDTPAPEGAYVSFASPAPGSKIRAETVHIKMNLIGMAVAPAGTAAAGTGHHHLLINTELEDPDAPIPADENHIHFGAGQTEVHLKLPPGTHTLRLVVGGANHIPHDPVIQSEPLEITVLGPSSMGPTGAVYDMFAPANVPSPAKFMVPAGN
jgi:hypothetical protein